MPPDRRAGAREERRADEVQRIAWLALAVLLVGSALAAATLLSRRAPVAEAADEPDASAPNDVAVAASSVLDALDERPAGGSDAGPAATSPAPGRPQLLPFAGVLGLGALVLSAGFVMGARCRHRHASVLVTAAGSHRTLLPPPGCGGLIALGREARRRGSATEAAGWFDAAARLYPSSVDARVELGRAFLATGRAEDAVEALAEACALHPTAHALRLELARALTLAGRARDALSELARVVDAAPARAAEIGRDAAFAGLADHPMFLALVGRV